MILMLDNYDSFTYNLVQGLATLTTDPIEVVRNDVASAEELLAKEPKAVVISPGPGTPYEAGVSMDLIRAAADRPLFGVCLGHQALAAVHGASVVRAPEPVHGKTSPIHHSGQGVFDGMPLPFQATRYHSLVVDRATIPTELEVTAWTDDGLVMALAHRERPHFGVQFHPESYLSVNGMALLESFLRLAGVNLAEGAG